MTVDELGNIDTAKLQRELTAALKEDAHRKTTDAMKKRAVHTATSYDEFRHMVSCASLTPVTTSQAANSKSKTTGHKKRLSGKGSGSADAIASLGPGAISGDIESRYPPSTALVFERDWKRCRSAEDRLAYLRFVGPKRLPRIFKVEMGPDVLGEILQTFCESFPNREGEEKGGGGDTICDPIGGGQGSEEEENGGVTVSGPCSGCPAEFEGTGTRCSGVEEGKAWLAKDYLTWMRALSRAGRFSSSVGFLGGGSGERLPLCLADWRLL
ncbi:unnamed protein product [Discosporangium mesarthrocarpum]